MTVVFSVAFGLLSLAALLTLARLVRGPRTLDRILALDMLLVLILAGVGVEMAMSQRPLNVALLLSVALLAFVGSLCAVKLAERREEYQ
ncbi:monovalent cation/H+ antiporter complex subunit F [Amycolatopsis cihanbeyliensis]|uniref:Multisubunit sodium/proton antiporter MrpF subunit n=1 Tax=Amycolatopsis cihanbeyliensis TaxID=1128664 RepID=A0A542DEE6_AMYCI|nr:monovalent cation/H+ antiporter complex subunit F [Amycolatopsis cihanbeyliensis]TQJ01432.1 multisubunit sodium/proton antiporter MrpF subunit [Amycolatopsis cihanbeyliensis]